MTVPAALRPFGLAALALALQGNAPADAPLPVQPPLASSGMPRIPQEGDFEFPFSLPEMPKGGFWLDFSSRLLQPDLLKGFAGMPVVKVDAFSFLADGEDGQGTPSPEAVTAFKDWMHANRPDVAARMDPKGDTEYETLLGAISKRTGAMHAYGTERPRILFINLSPAKEARMTSSNVMLAVQEAHEQSGAYKTMKLLGKDFKPQALVDSIFMAQTHGFYTDARIEAFVAWSFIGRPETAQQTFLTWYAHMSGVDPIAQQDKLDALGVRVEGAVARLRAAKPETVLETAYRMSRQNRGMGIEAAFARAFLDAQPQIILENKGIRLPMRTLGSYVLSYERSVAPVRAPKLAPRR